MNILYKQIHFFLYIATILFAVSAPPFPLEIEQSDGLKIPVRMHGDEYNNWMETKDGYTIMLIDDGVHKNWYYCVLNTEGKFISSGVRVAYPAPSDLEIPKYLRESMHKKRNSFHNYGNVHGFHNTSLQRNSSENILKPLVFLVEFSDEQSTYSKSDFEKLLFEQDLSPGDIPEHDYNMSVRDYFDEISNGLQNVDGTVTDWQMAEEKYSYYVDGNSGQGEGDNLKLRSAGSLVVETALNLHEKGLDFRQFDNGHGAIDVIILVVAGQGVAYADDDYFWPHMYFIPTGEDLSNIDPNALQSNEGYLKIDGVVIQKYIVIHEKYAFIYGGADPGDIHPIGTFCHEIGHVLGVPDLYDNSITSAAGIGDWGLMGSGNWMSQTSPTFMSAWSRYNLGYIEPGIIENVQDYSFTINAAEGANQNAAYLLPLDSNMPQEYLLIENRQQILSDINLPGSGLLVWHIDETITDVYPLHASVNQDPNFFSYL